MKVLIVGNGGREHALAWKVAQSNLVTQVFVAPGNGGTALEESVSNIDIKVTDINGLQAFAKTENIDLTIVGSETPLSMGIVDEFNKQGLACFGPTQQAAQLESSKSYSKMFMQRHQIPTADHATFIDLTTALDYLTQQTYPIVIKADGLAAGKGVMIVDNYEQAAEAATSMLSGNVFGTAGNKIVVESFLVGEEVSYICMVDGVNILPLASSQDHKAAYDNDTGPNTGGMGAYSPAPIVDEVLNQRILDNVIQPTINGLMQDGISFVGFLYAGLMIDRDKNPQVLEYNCRLGDPETQPILMRMQSDLVAHCLAALNGQLDTQQAQWHQQVALGVVLASEGYPNDCETGRVIHGLSNNGNSDNEDNTVKVFHAGTQLDNDVLHTSGGRVLCVTALDNDIAAAKSNAYQVADRITWQGCWCRSDIGDKALIK